MAQTNQVTLTFAGDSSQLEKTFGAVGESARDMSGEVDSASSTVGGATASFDELGDSARGTSSRMDSLGTGVGATEQKLRGFRDIIDGSGDAVRGFATGDISLMTKGFADIAAGSADLVIPALQRFTTWLGNTRVGILAKAAAEKTATATTKALTGAQKALNMVLRANPIGLVITVLAALGAAFVTAYNKSETFRDIVRSGLAAVRDAFGWVVDRGDDMVGWFRDLPGKIQGFFSGLGDLITAPFDDAVSGIKSIWNSTLGGRGFDVPGWVPGIGGNSYRIPYLHQGGIVPGAPGQDVLTMLQAGERVTPAAQVRADAGRGGDEPVVVNVAISRREIAGIAEVEVRRGQRRVKKRVDRGSSRPTAGVAVA